MFECAIWHLQSGWSCLNNYSVRKTGSKRGKRGQSIRLLLYYRRDFRPASYTSVLSVGSFSNSAKGASPSKGPFLTALRTNSEFHPLLCVLASSRVPC